MGRPAGAKNKPKEKPMQAENCGTCVCSSVIQNNPQMRNWLHCRLFPEMVKKQPHQWCRQWEMKLHDPPPVLAAAPDPEKEQEPHPASPPAEAPAEAPPDAPAPDDVDEF